MGPAFHGLAPCCYPHLSGTCPVGAFDRSPARSAGERTLETAVSPVGTIEPATFSRPYGTHFARDGCVPSDKSLGYVQMSLRDRVFAASQPFRKMWVTARLAPGAILKRPLRGWVGGPRRGIRELPCLLTPSSNLDATPFRDAHPCAPGQAAGWPWVIAHPGLPQIRTCAIDAYGSSGHGFATRRW